MIRELLYELYNGYRQIIGTGAVLVLVLASLLVIARTKKNGRNILPLILSPLSACSVAVTAVFDHICKKDDETSLWKKAAAIFAALAVILAVAASGKSVFSSEFTERAENDMHLPGYVLSAMEAIKEDGSEPVVITMPGWEEYFTSMSSVYELPLYDGRNDVLSSVAADSSTVSFELGKKDPDMRKISEIAKRNGCKYIVLSDDLWPAVRLTSCGYEIVRECGGCTVYKEVNTP